MKAKLLLVCLLIGIPGITQAQRRKCWYCKNARGNEECLRKGHLIQCLPNQRYCQNEIRAIAGGIYFEVTKRCKQDNACGNNRMQNFTGSMPFQCDTEKPHSVCRCCCGFDNCNGPEVACLTGPPSCPERPEAPINGLVTCPTRLLVGSRCVFRCRPGFRLIGPSSTECTSSGAEVFWSNGPPRCISEPCPPLVEPENGAMLCTDEWNIGSECSFTCEPGRVLVGRQTLRCSIFSKWDGEVPTCRTVTCRPPRPLDPNFVPRQGQCTNRYNFNSVCTFTCHPDYDIIGEDQLTCGLPIRRNRATWDRRPPRCRIKRCIPAYCSTNRVGDTCSFSCERCQELIGNSEIECRRDGWTGVPGTCRTITCGDPPGAPENGDILCTSGGNECDESCRYTCNSGYRLVGNSRITCLQSGSWSGPAPICELFECDPIRINGISSTCTNGFAVGSQCTLTCNADNFEFVGQSEVRCKKDATDPLPVWEPSLTQYCRPILCPNFPSPGEFPPAEAGSLTCGLPSQRVNNDRDGRQGWRVGAQCNIQCNDRYQAKYLITETDCTSSGNWTVSRLCCVRCLTNTALDVVVLLDNTEPDFRNARLEFLAQLVDFMTFAHSFDLNITFIPFGDEVDYGNDIPFMPIDDDLNAVDDFDFLVKRFAGVPSEEGQDSNSGKALQEAVDNIFGFHNFRVPVVFLFTTKIPSDLAVARAAAQQLRDRQIHLRIFPVIGNLQADAGASRDVFRSLVNDDTYVIEGSETEETAENFYLLSDDGLITVTERHCNNRAQGLQPCIFDT